MAVSISDPGTQLVSLINDALADQDKGQSWLGVRVAEIEGRSEPFSQSAVSQWLDKPDNLRPDRVFSIEKALGKVPGSLSRLFGYVPASAAPALSVPDAIAADPQLTDGARRILVAAYRSALHG